MGNFGKQDSLFELDLAENTSGYRSLSSIVYFFLRGSFIRHQSNNINKIPITLANVSTDVFTHVFTDVFTGIVTGVFTDVFSVWGLLLGPLQPCFGNIQRCFDVAERIARENCQRELPGRVDREN